MHTECPKSAKEVLLGMPTDCDIEQLYSLILQERIEKTGESKGEAERHGTNSVLKPLTPSALINRHAFDLITHIRTNTIYYCVEMPYRFILL